MKKILFLILMAFSAHMMAQDTFMLGNQNGREWVSKFLGFHNEVLVGVKVKQNTNRNKMFEVLFFDQQLNMIGNKEFSFPSLDADRMELVNVEMLKDEIIVFYECELRPLNEMKLVSTVYDFQGNQKVEFQVVDQVPMNKKYKGAYFNLGYSMEEEKMFSYVNHSQWTDSLFLTYTVFNHLNDKLNIDSTIVLTKHKRPVEILESILDKKGNIHFLCAKSSSSSVASNYLDRKYFILSYYKEGKKFQEHQLNLGSFWISEASIFITQDSVLNFTGFYSSNRKRVYNGVFQLKMNVNNGGLIYAKYNNFSSEIIEHLGNKNSRQRGLQDYYLQEVLFDSLGGAYLIAENQYVEVSSYMDPTSRVISYDYYYNYGNALIFYLSPEGILMSSEVLEKKQQTINDDGRYSSFISYLDAKGQLNFVYNDHPSNKTDYVQPMDDPKKAVVAHVKYDANNIPFKTILDFEKRDVYLKPQSYIQNNGSLYLLFQEDKDLVLGRLD